jgi:ferredoxin-NADP reductase
MIPAWQTGIVKQIEQVTPFTRRFIVELPEVEIFDFKPGQFVTLDLPIHEQRNKRWRSYSIASWPNGTNTIELLIVALEGGAGTKYLFNEIKEGSQLTLRGPQGIFVLPPELNKDLYLVCTGTGIAPFRSMVHYIQQNNIPHQEIHLVFGTRTQADLLYYDELKALEQTMPGFHYHPVLSRQEWEGKTGYVHHIYEQLSHHNPPAYFMLCGWRAMTDEAKERILRKGYTSKDVHIEIYG